MTSLGVLANKRCNHARSGRGRAVLKMNELPGWYFTAPWDPVPIRRGDALGFRAGADYFADLLAPGLSNAASDARWISLLSWCLTWSHVVWRNAGGGDLSRRDGQRARYAWLRPLELLWVDRALESGQTTGQLRGRRSIERWRKAERHLPNFAMSPDQFRRYRQVGTYGAYRVVLRTVPGLTMGDGWTPADTALQLATLVNESLPRDVRLEPKRFESGTKWGHWADDEARYWVRHGWPAAWAKAGSGLLPTPNNAVGKRLPEEERRLLEPALFREESTRRVTAEALAGAKEASSHAALCDTLAASRALSKKIEPRSLAPLPAFTRFADASMHAMRGLWTEINTDAAKQAPGVDTLARSSELRARLELVRETGAAWLRAPGRSVFPHDDVMTRLAEATQAATTPIDQLRALARHHHEHGGGRRWFREQAGKMVPLVADTGIAASDYRFRLRPLSRLAAQCGVARMNDVLDAVDRHELEDTARSEPDDEEGDAL
ncbi:MAG: hypothetical protein IT374_25060 [Polyangiaceae bacterium]|nr:hypothetical protein [Polyangiaceae bacterium]